MLHGTILVGNILDRVVQSEEVDAFFLGVLHLFETCRHLSLGTAVHECDVSAKSFSRTTRVHSRVATTNDEYVLCWIKWRVGCRISRIHEVHTREVFVRRHDVYSILARNVHEVRQAGTRTDKYSLEALLLKFLYRDCLSYDYVSLEMHAHLSEVLDLHIDNTVRKTELRNAILQHTADFVKCLEHINIESLLYHIASETQS